MNDIVIRKIKEAVFEISGAGNLGGRSNMKFNIYLNAMQDVAIMHEDGKVIIAYNSGDEHVVAKSIKDIVAFLGTCKVEVSLDEDTRELLEHHQEFENISANKIESLRAIKSNDVGVAPNFNKRSEERR